MTVLTIVRYTALAVVIIAVIRRRMPHWPEITACVTLAAADFILAIHHFGEVIGIAWAALVCLWTFNTVRVIRLNRRLRGL